MLSVYHKAYIFGAHTRAKTLMGYIRELYPDILILGFLVDDKEENEECIDEIPVIHIDKERKFDITAAVLLATKGAWHFQIAQHLREKGFSLIYPLSPVADNALRNEYVAKIYKKQNRTFIKIENCNYEKNIPDDLKKIKNQNTSTCIYVAQSVYDRVLQTNYSFQDYEKPIQVGSVLTTERIKNVECVDCTGDNISIKNRQYCELTGLYWFWKNSHYDIAGLVHYRRHFILPDNWIQIMICEKIDAIVPVPTYVYPNIEDNYKQRHIPEDWDFLISYLRENDRIAYENALEVFRESLYLPCNMFIAKWEVLDSLCSWMFPILDAVVKNGGIKKDIYMNRYAGFISERLITLFFYINRDKYKIVYADRIFLQ